MNIRRAAGYIGIFLCASAIAGFGFYSVISTYQYKKVLSLLGLTQSAVYNASTLRYGVVDAVDPDRRTMIVTITRFSPENEKTRITINVLPDAYIARQSLEGSNGIYDSLSPQVQARLSDIRPGDRVAIHFVLSGKSLNAIAILFGNPL